MQLNNTVPITRQEPFAIKLALVLALSADEVKPLEDAQPCQIVAPISKLSAGLDDLKLDAADFIATRCLTQDI